MYVNTSDLIFILDGFATADPHLHVNQEDVAAVKVMGSVLVQKYGCNVAGS